MPRVDQWTPDMGYDDPITGETLHGTTNFWNDDYEFPAYIYSDENICPLCAANGDYTVITNRARLCKQHHEEVRQRTKEQMDQFLERHAHRVDVQRQIDEAVRAIVPKYARIGDD